MSNDAITRYKAKVTSPLSGIRAKCVECQGGQVQAVNRCKAKSCPLWLFREGGNPFHKRNRKRGLEN